MSRLTLIGDSLPIRELRTWIQKVAPVRTNILILGESGTGKEIVARMIHEESQPKSPFVAINCGAIPENLIESELFGHQKGSFTGAIQNKKGLFELAHRGVIFLDEIGELPLSMQAKMLRVLQEKSFKAVGGVEEIRVDVRIVAATNRNLLEDVKKGLFREDLYYRLNVITIQTPPLRSHREDIPSLVEHFVTACCQKFGKKIPSIELKAMDFLVNYSWPGNVRQLENVIERAVALEAKDHLDVDSFPSEIKVGTDAIPHSVLIEVPIRLPVQMEKIEKWFLLFALEKANFKKRKTSELLGIDLEDLQCRLDKFHLNTLEES